MSKCGLGLLKIRDPRQMSNCMNIYGVKCTVEKMHGKEKARGEISWHEIHHGIKITA